MDSNDSGLFGNNHDLSPGKHQNDETEPYMQDQQSTHEPLFPAAPAAASPLERSWTEATPESIVYNHQYQGQTFDEQGYSKLHYDTLEADAVEQAQASNGAVPSTHETPLTEMVAGSTDGDAPSLPSDSHPATNDAVAAASSSLSSMESSVPSSTTRYASSAYLGDLIPVQGKVTLSNQELLFNRHFAVLTDLIQHGAWPQALQKLQMMRAEYPNVPALDALLDEAMLKSELMTTWTDQIKGRRLTVHQEWLLRRSLPFVLLLVLFISGAIFYQTFVAPSRQVLAMERANQALIEEASGLLNMGRVDEAIGLYDLVLSRNADNRAAQQGLVDASRLSGVVVTYDLAIRVANQGNLQRSLGMLQSIKAQSPSFRDIDARIERVSSLLNAEASYQLAEKAFAQHRWLDAIAHYEETQLRASDYQAIRVGLQLNVAYFMAGQKLMTQWPTSEFTTGQVRDFMHRAGDVNGQDALIRPFVAHLDDFIKGERALNNNNLDQSVRVWRELYDVQSNFLGGYLAEQLYRAYLALAANVRNSDAAYARELYTLAAAMPVGNSSEARAQLRNLGAPIPAAQPTPTPRPTVAYFAPVGGVAPVVAVATPTPAPTVPPIIAYQGWIAFRSTRDGGEQIYVMRGNGSEQQLAPEELRGQIDALYQNDRRGPDGQLAYVQAATGRSDANIYITSSDGVNGHTLTNYTGDEYDPVWSRAGDRIAFVANHTGNDEIWIMRVDGSEARQLTSNNWEWDKHPTWSPDGGEIAFFSNRSGQRQIWVMSSDGTSQRNLSANVYDDWDPVWIK